MRRISVRLDGGGGEEERKEKEWDFERGEIRSSRRSPARRLHFRRIEPSHSVAVSRIPSHCIAFRRILSQLLFY